MGENFSWTVPTESRDEYTTVEVSPGETLFMVGANGSGKSALNYWMYKTNKNGKAVRVTGHRKIWMDSSGPEMTSSRYKTDSAFSDQLAQKPDSRYREQSSNSRASSILYELAARVNARNQRVASMIDENENIPMRFDVEPSPLKEISSVFSKANLYCIFGLNDVGEFTVSQDGETYPIAEMSDGEKSAFLLAAEVILASAGSVLLIDEPERHLHRAISPDFIKALIELRDDCAFVLFTHDLESIPSMPHRDRQLYFVQSVRWRGGVPVSWGLQRIESEIEGLDEVRAAILGGRNNLLLVEGTTSSADSRLYEILFPNWTVVPCGSSSEVIRGVSGLGAQKRYHWIDSFGIIDGDCRSQEERSKYQERGICVLDVNEVESLYYLPFIVEEMARIRADELELDPLVLLGETRDRSLSAIGDEATISSLAVSNAHKVARMMFLEKFPSVREFSKLNSVEVSVASMFEREKGALNKAILSSDHDFIVRNYSIRNSPYCSKIATGLRFIGCDDYEAAVRSSIRKNGNLAGKVRDVMGAVQMLEGN